MSLCENQSRFLMQTIFRTIPTSHFIQLSNRHISNGMHSDDKNVLNHLLSKPENWRLRVNEICKTLVLSEYKVRKALKRLRIAGYVFMERLRGGFTRWFIYSEPKAETQSISPVTPVLMPHVEKSHVNNLDVLVIKKETEILKEQQPIPIPEQKTVVVFLDDKEDLIYPAQLTKDQKKSCKAVIKKAPIAVQQDVLFELAYRMTLQNIRSVPGFLNTLVTSANNGTFTRTQAGSATKTDTKHIDKTQQLLNEQREIKRSVPDVAKPGIGLLKAALRGM